MNIAFALIPALIWGCTPLWVSKCGGKPIEQLLGTTYGALIIGLILYLIKQPEITASSFLWCFLAGVGWSIGQLTQYIGFKRLSVTTSSPIVAGIQLVGVDLIGVLCFGSWHSTLAKIIGAIAILIVIGGVYLTTLTAGNEPSSQPFTNKANIIKNIALLILGTGIGYTACSVLPKIPETNGWASFPPQSIGMIISALLFAFCLKKKSLKKIVFDRHTLRNIFTGFNSGLGTFTYLVSIMLTNLSTAFTLSQMNIIVTVLGSFLILHEHEHGRSLIYTILGVALVLIGGALTSFLK